MSVWANPRNSNVNAEWLASTQRRWNSLLHQLNNALCIHKENLSLRLLVKCSSVAVKDVSNLGTRHFNME